MTNDIQAFIKQSSEKFKSVRTRKNLSIRQLASLSRVSSDIISRFENENYSEIRIKAFIGIAIALDIDFEKLSE